jgi:septal ring factor EnvC (AmiA/AmiB activator)
VTGRPLEETQRLHEAKEKQHQDRERSLLEQLQDAETDFAKLQAALEKEKKVALNKLRAEIERLQLGNVWT